MESAKKMGRPRKPEYTQKKMRFSAWEKAFKEVINESIITEKERKTAEKVFEALKQKLV